AGGRGQRAGRGDGVLLGIDRSRPRDVLSARDVPAAHRALVRVFGHVQPRATVLLGRAHVDERALLRDMLLDVLAERPERGVVARLYAALALPGRRHGRAP